MTSLLMPAHSGCVSVCLSVLSVCPSVHTTACDYHFSLVHAVPAEELSLVSGAASELRVQLSQAQQTNLDQQLQVQRSGSDFE